MFNWRKKKDEGNIITNQPTFHTVEVSNPVTEEQWINQLNVSRQHTVYEPIYFEPHEVLTKEQTIKRKQQQFKERIPVEQKDDNLLAIFK